MAETDEYPSTPLLSSLSGFLALVIKHANTKLSEPTAKRLILDYYAEVRPRRRYHYQIGFTLDVDTNSRKLRFVAIDPRHWRGRYGGIRVRVDWEDSSVGPDDPRYEMRLVRLYTGDAFAILRWAEFLEPALPPAIDAAVTPALPPPTGGTELWVYNTMKHDPPRTSDPRGQYVDKLEQRCTVEGIQRKTLANYFYKYKKQFERP